MAPNRHESVDPVLTTIPTQDTVALPTSECERGLAPQLYSLDAWPGSSCLGSLLSE